MQCTIYWVYRIKSVLKKYTCDLCTLHNCQIWVYIIQILTSLKFIFLNMLPFIYKCTLYIVQPILNIIFWGGFFSFCSYIIQHCFICRPSDSTVPTDAGIEPRTVATGALAVRRSNHKAKSHPNKLSWLPWCPPIATNIIILPKVSNA